MKKEYIFVFGLGIFLVFKNLLSLSVGSDTDPSRQGYVIFPSADIDNAMVGYASFENGFKLTDLATTCSFDSLMEVSGPVDLSGGDLYLMESLCFSDTVSINSMGNIYGNGKTIKLAPSITELNSVSEGSMVAVASYYMGAQVNSVDFSDTASYAVAVTQNNSGTEVRMLYYDGLSLTMTAEVSMNRHVHSCRFQPGQTNFVVGRNRGGGDELYSYAFNVSNGDFNEVSSLRPSGNKSIHALSFLSGGDYLAVGRSVQGGGNDNEVLLFSASTGGALSQEQSQSLPGPDRTIQKNAVSWSPGSNYVAYGTAVDGGEGDLLIYYFNGSTMTATIELETGLTVRGLDWSPTGTFLAVALEGTTTQNLLIFSHNISNGSLNLETSAFIDDSVDAIAPVWTSDGNKLAVGSALFDGVGAFRTYSFDKTTTTLSLDKSFAFASSVNAVRNIPFTDKFIVGAGDSVYILANEYVSDISFTVDSVTIELANDLTLKTPLNFTNQCAILGNNHAIDFKMTGSIIIGSQSSLYLKNITLKNFGGTQVRCFDNSSTVSLDNVRFLFDSPYQFNAGRLDILGSLQVSGTNLFSYESPTKSTIYSGASWIFDNFSTLSYAPVSNDRQLIQMIDQTSRLIFNNATLYSTATGLSLTKGELWVDGRMSIKSDAVLTAEGIEWGDGLTSGNDLHVVVMPGARVSLESGYLVNKNIG
ncbi:beta-propeller fold lactonase family protein [Candidatus Babeliales bacterium]|nr:beta-propeller fold lactonase family protein [Candidatus Babeliales bacterium]